MKTEDIFNANSYTSKAMPVTYELVSKLNYHVFDTVSDEMSELTKKNRVISDKANALYFSLSKEQQKILDEEYDSSLARYTLTQNENFAKGLKLGFRLAMELLG